MKSQFRNSETTSSKVDKMQTRDSTIPTIMVLASLLFSGVAQADGGGKFTVENNEEIPITISSSRTNHCYQCEPDMFENMVLQPGEKHTWSWWHPGDYRGCADVAAEFYITFDPAVVVMEDGKKIEKNKIGYWGDRGDGFGLMVSDKDRFPGKLSKVDGNKRTFRTGAGFKGNTSKAKLVSNALVIRDYMDGDRSSAVEQTVTITASEEAEIENEAELEAEVSAGYNDLTTSLKAELRAKYVNRKREEKKKEKEQMNSERGTWKMDPDKMKIGMYTANIYKDADGNVFEQTSEPITYVEFSKKADKDRYSKSLLGAYTKVGAIKTLDGLTLVNMHDENGNEIDCPYQIVATRK